MRQEFYLKKKKKKKKKNEKALNRREYPIWVTGILHMHSIPLILPSGTVISKKKKKKKEKKKKSQAAEN